MNRIIVSAGMFALGVAGANAAPAMSSTADKPWSVSATLRGFYDDNYAMRTTNRLDSFGFELNPTIGVGVNGQQTSAGASYSYTLRYFDDRHPHMDHTHEFNAWLSHQFTERYALDVHDTFVYSVEPTLTQPGTGVIFTQGTAAHNSGVIDFSAQITRLFGTVVGYRNEFYDYKNKTYSIILDRIEHYAHLDLTWTFTPQTVFITGYQFGDGVYTDRSTPFSRLKDFYAHYFYLGVKHNFNTKLSFALEAGARYTDYHNIPKPTPPGVHRDTFGPYVRGSMRYQFLPGSYVEAGFVHDRTATDLTALDSESSLFYATLSHSFTPKLIGSLTGQVQDSETDLVGVPTTHAHEWLYTVGLSLDYHFTPNLAANIAYDFDTVDSNQTLRSYDRNRIFLGFTASY